MCCVTWNLKIEERGKNATEYINYPGRSTHILSYRAAVLLKIENRKLSLIKAFKRL